MWKLKSKKSGFTVIEVMCALTLFTVIFTISVSIRFCTAQINIYNTKMERYINYISQVKSEMLNNMSDEDMSFMLNSEELYIDKKSMENEQIKDSSLTRIVTKNLPREKPYMKISLVNGSLIAVNLELYTDILKKEEVIHCKFYKAAVKNKR